MPQRKSSTYEAATPDFACINNATVRLRTDNETQPDVLFRIEQGDQSVISDDDSLKVHQNESSAL